VSERKCMMESKGVRFLAYQSIFSSVGSGDFDGVKKLVEKVKNEEGSSLSDVMSLQNDAGESALYIAAENNLQEIFSYLLNLCDFEAVKIRSKSDMNAFHVAAKRGHLGWYFYFILFVFIWIESFLVRKSWILLLIQLIHKLF